MIGQVIHDADLLDEKFGRKEGSLQLLGKIVNGADTDNPLWQQPEAAGMKCHRGGIPAPGI